MKWFQLDSDTPNDPKVKAIIRRGLPTPVPGQAAAGALLLLWCYIANHGSGSPGHGVNGSGEPLPLDEMADECLFGSVPELVAFLDFLAEKRHIEPETWHEQRIVLLPAMQQRADAYARSKGRDKAGPEQTGRGKAGGKLPVEPPTSQTDTVQLEPEKEQELFPGPTPAELVAEWNKLRTKGPKVDRITQQRKGQYSKALREHPNLDEWRKVITWLDGESWANAPGTGQYPSWRADLDYLTRPGKMQKALERAAAAPIQGGSKGRVTAPKGKYAHVNQAPDTGVA